MSSRTSVFLVGFMGSGKTTVGQALAGRLGLPFHDTDRVVEQRAGQPIERIFADRGEEVFRQLEWEVLRDLPPEAGAVVATGGGAFTRHASRRWMASRGRVVWLDAEEEVLVRRVGSGSGRPLWDATDAVGRRAFLARRRALYALAELRVDASRGTPAELAQRIERELGLEASGCGD